MSTSDEPPLYLTPSTYPLDAHSDEEIARLFVQHAIITEYTGGLFPERPDLSHVQDILDLACGSGGWVVDVARAYPQINVMGVDLSIRMIMYGRAQALLYQRANARFRLMNVLKPLDFPDHSLDLINGRFLASFVPPASWKGLLQECMRLLRPGGIIRLTEAEPGITNSPACEKLNWLALQALQKAGQSFSPDGRHLGITPMLGPLLRKAGYRNVQNITHALDYSAGTEPQDSLSFDYQLGLKKALPFLLKHGVTTEEEFDELLQKAKAEMYSEEFCAIQFFVTTWGERP
jgi:SAM-dependent methyltransferase